MNFATTHHIASATVSHKGSHFHGFLCPSAQFEATLQSLRDEHPKAVHFVTSTRAFNAHQQIVESFSDDGEPKGSSGMPTLNVLRGANLVNVGFVSVRYFGGTLLGIGGLVRAYTDCALQTIANAELAPYIALDSLRIHVPFAKLQHAQYLIKKLDITMLQQNFDGTGAELVLQASGEILRAFTHSLGI
ncbi:MAG: YigZ family protein [Helicobacter sp.]|nr:YigZ family protein [Helicobacter sp.]